MSEKTIWKFHFHLKNFFTVNLPIGADIISVQIMGRSLYAWAIIDPLQDLEERSFSVIGTGHEMPKGRIQHLGTVQVEDLLVFHVFEILNP